MSRIVCYEVPQPDFSLQFDNEQMVAQFPDYYPKLEVEALKQSVAETQIAAAEAYELGSNANSIASQADETATTAQQTATIAAEAANTAAKTIATHAQKQDNPHAENTNQTFAEVGLSALQSEATGGSVPEPVYSWFKSVYASLVDKSVKSWITGLVTFVKSLTERVGVLEDNYIIKVIVPEEVDSVEVTHDRFGQPLNIRDLKTVTIFFRCDFGSTQELANRLNLRFNGVSSAIYRWYSSVLNFLPTSDANDLWSSGSVEITLIDREVQGVTFVKTNRGRTSFSFDTSGLNSASINSILFYPNNSALKIPAGTIIVIK